MKALIQKDFYVIFKQMRIFILLLLFMMAIGNNHSFYSIFVVVWCSMLPYTTIAYDEQSHWNQMAAMMPYSKREIVLSKYVFGWLCIAASSLLCLVIQTIAGAFSFNSETLPILLVSICLGVFALDLTLPMVLRFGVERGRMIFMILLFGIAGSIGFLIDKPPALSRSMLPVLMVVMVLAAVIFTAISVALSMKLYKES